MIRVKMLVVKYVTRFALYLNRKCNDKKFNIFTPFLWLIKLILSYFNLSIYELNSHQRYVDTHADSEFYQIKKNRNAYTSHVLFNFDLQKDVIACKAPDTYVSVIHEVNVIGSSNMLITKDNKALNDFGFDMDDNYMLSDPITYNKNENFVLIHSNKPTRVISEAILLAGNFSWNYYHFLYEYIVRFMLINSMTINISIPIIIDSHVINIPQLKQIFDIFNKNSRQTIVINPKEVLSVSKLYVPSSINIIPPNIKNIFNVNYKEILFDFESLDFIRETVKDKITRIEYPSKLFISRIDRNNRKYNEAEIITMLNKYGFTPFQPENFSFYDQIAIFNNADFIIGASGAALSNIIFCKENCKVVCLTYANIDNPIFATIANYSSIELRYFIGEPRNKLKSTQSDFNIDVKRFEDFIIKINNH